MWLQFFLLLFALAESRRLGDVFWNSSNPIFDMSNTDHVKSVRIFDRISILCPKPLGAENYEFSKLYAVNRQGYERCELLEEKLIGVCLSPQKPSSMSIVFRDFSPVPGAMEFRAGHSYFIISTSNGSLSGVDNKADGLCKTKHMKLKFEVLSDDEHNDPKPHTQSNEYDAAGGSSTNVEDNPLMYIIHTINPESDGEDRNIFLENDDGFASSTQPNVVLISLCLVTAILWLKSLL